MTRISNHPVFPDTKSVEEALRALILTCGGTHHALWARDCYEPLANYFGLSSADRTLLRSEYLRDGRNEPYWNTWVQWAKDKLEKRDEVTCPRRGLWKLTDRGIALARPVQLKYERAEAMFRSHNFQQVQDFHLKPTEELTAEDLGL